MLARGFLGFLEWGHWRVAAGPDVFVPVRQRVDAVLQYPALGVEGGKCCFVEMHSIDLVVYTSEHVHPVLVGLPAE